MLKKFIFENTVSILNYNFSVLEFKNWGFSVNETLNGQIIVTFFKLKSIVDYTNFLSILSRFDINSNLIKLLFCSKQKQKNNNILILKSKQNIETFINAHHNFVQNDSRLYLTSVLFVLKKIFFYLNYVLFLLSLLKRVQYNKY